MPFKKKSKAKPREIVVRVVVSKPSGSSGTRTRWKKRSR